MITWMLALVLAAGSASGRQQNDQAEILLQQALQKDMIEGKLDEAIRIYRKVATEHAADRAAAAKAWVEIGRCYEKLGRAEARQAYARVVREYADQTEAAAVARRRLAALEASGGASAQPAANSGPVSRQVWTAGGFLPFLDVSADGRYLAVRDQYRLKDDPKLYLAVRDLTTGEIRRIASPASDVSWEFPRAAKFSPDGKLIAYTWTIGSRSEFRIVAADGSSASRTLHNGEGGTEIFPEDWMPDGKRIVALIIENSKARTMTRAFVSPADGAIQRFGDSFDFFKSWPNRIVSSPDGRFLAWDPPVGDPKGKGDIYVRDVAAGLENPVVQNAADDKVLGWTADGGTLVLSSDRSGTTDLWVQAMEEGKAKGAPQMVKRDLGSGVPIRLTRGGSLYQRVVSGTMDLYSVGFDPESGTVTGTPVSLNPRFPLNLVYTGGATLDWSRDGKYFCYPVKNRESVAANLGLAIRSLETGEERELDLKSALLSFYHPLWSPDGRSVMLTATDKDAGFGLYRVDPQTGDVARMVAMPPNVNLDPSPSWAPDGKAVFYKRRDEPGSPVRILRRDLATGQDKELSRGKNALEMTLSHDGRQLAYFTTDSATNSYLLMLLDAGGGEPRQIARATGGSLTWTRDNRNIVYANGPDLWIVPAAGGEPRKLVTVGGATFGPALHPNGRILAFNVHHKIHELWVLENFLPPPVAQ